MYRGVNPTYLLMSCKVEINLKRYPTPYPEDLKNIVKSVQNMRGGMEKCPPGMVVAEHQGKDKYERGWQMAMKDGIAEVASQMEATVKGLNAGPDAVGYGFQVRTPPELLPWILQFSVYLCE